MLIDLPYSYQPTRVDDQKALFLSAPDMPYSKSQIAGPITLTGLPGASARSSPNRPRRSATTIVGAASSLPFLFASSKLDLLGWRHPPKRSKLSETDLPQHLY